MMQLPSNLDVNIINDIIYPTTKGLSILNITEYGKTVDWNIPHGNFITVPNQNWIPYDWQNYVVLPILSSGDLSAD